MASSALHVQHLLQEKEKDLELAAKIGQSLLEENRELQTRNEFLEQSLCANNEAVVQLRHELQLRSDLLHVCTSSSDYDHDRGDENCSRERRGGVEPLRRRVHLLEEMNSALQQETGQLKRQVLNLEEKEQRLITDCVRQMDEAHQRVTNLRSRVLEKNEECSVKSAQVESLIKEVAMRKSTERTLARANDELHSALQDAITCQETLSNEVIDIQQRYTEVLAMLHDAEEELRVHRQRPTPHRRTHSADSLYDSLASELEASDSGFYASPSSSARRTDDSHRVTERERDTSAIVDVPSTVLASLHAPIDHHLQSHNFKCNSGKMAECPDGSPLGAGRRADSPMSLLFGQSETSIVHCSTPIRRRTSSRASIESLGSYDGPALGEPGRPGTRDFDFSIRRLRIQLEKDYAIFRKQRHLCISPIPIASLPTRGSRGDLIGGGLLDAISPIEASKQVLTRESTGSRIAFSLHIASPRPVSSSFSSPKRVVVPE